MEFEEFKTKVVNTAVVTESLVYQCIKHRIPSAWYPLEVVSLGNNKDAVIRIPATHLNPKGNEVGVLRLQEELFARNQYVTDVILPDTLCEIPREAFRGCTNLKHVVIPCSVRAIASDAFDGCDSLEDVYYGGTEEAWARLNHVVHKAGVHYNCNINKTAEGKKKHNGNK